MRTSLSTSDTLDARKSFLRLCIKNKPFLDRNTTCSRRVHSTG